MVVGVVDVSSLKTKLGWSSGWPEGADNSAIGPMVVGGDVGYLVKAKRSEVKAPTGIRAMSGDGGVWGGAGVGGLATGGVMDGRGIGALVVVEGRGVWGGGGRNPRERGTKEGRWWGEAKIREASRVIWAMPR